MTAPQCHYCLRNEEMDKIALKITDLSVSTLFLFREQSHPGRCCVAYKDHISEIVDLSAEERARFMNDVAKAAAAIHKAYQPDKVNYGAYGDLNPHLHFHLVPKYRDDFEWGGIFTMNPGKTYLSEAEYKAAAEKIKAAL